MLGGVQEAPSCHYIERQHGADLAADVREGRFQRGLRLLNPLVALSSALGGAGLSWATASEPQHKEQGVSSWPPRLSRSSKHSVGECPGARISALYSRQWLTFITVT